MPEETTSAVPIPIEEVLAQLKTRGFESGGFTTPLRDFYGRLTEITGVMRTGNSGPYLQVLYNFGELEVLESTEPYLAPTAQIAVSQSTRERSRMGYLGHSIDNIINAGLPDDAPAEQVKGQEFLRGKRQRWVITGGHPIWNQQQGKEIPVECWTVMEVEGFNASTPIPATTGTTADGSAATGKTAMQEAIDLLDGKTLADWQQVVFTNDIVRVDTELVNKILGGQFVPEIVSSGAFTIDGDGVYHKAEPPATA